MPARGFDSAVWLPDFPQATRWQNPLAHPGNAPYKPPDLAPSGATVARVAQLVEQRIENPRVTGSIPVPGTISLFAKVRE
jgi:hypothetical protein